MLPAAGAGRPARRVQGPPPRGLAGDARRAQRDGLAQLLAVPRRRRAARRLPRDRGLRGRARRDGGARTSTRAGRPRWRSSSSCPPTRAPTPACAASRRCSTLPEPPATPRSTWARRAAGSSPAGSPAGGSRSRRCTASPTGPCGCRTACAGTCCTCSRSRSRACAAPGRCAAWGRHLGRRLRAARRARPRARAAVPLPRRAHRRHGRARLRPRAAGRALRRHGDPDAADQHRLPAARRRGLARARPRRERLALVPDLLASWLCGERANERTNASTTGLLDARSGEWAHELIGRLGLPARLFGALVEPGTPLGPLLAHHELGAAAGVRRREPRHRVGLRRRARAPTSTPRSCRAAPGRCSGSSCPSRCCRRGARREPDQRARRRRHHAAAQERDGHVAAGGVPARLGPTPPTRSCTGSPRRRPATPRCSIPTTTRFLAPGRHAGPDRRGLRADRAARAGAAPARSSAASSSRSPASTAGCSSAWRRSAAATCDGST